MQAAANKKAWLLLGGNIGDTMFYLTEAKARIEKVCGQISKASAIYQTAAWGNEKQADYLNQALEIETLLPPAQLLNHLLTIEQELGRLRIERWAERTIDIDILYFGNETIKSEKLTIPHPMVHLRRFALIPMVEIAAGLIHPEFQKTQRQLLESCPDALEVKLLKY